MNKPGNGSEAPEASILALIKRLSKERVVKQEQDLQSMQQRATLSSRAEIISGSEHAERLADRHNSHLMSREYVLYSLAEKNLLTDIDNILQTLDEDDQLRFLAQDLLKDPAKAKDLYKTMIGTANDHGFFMQRYSAEYQAARLNNPNFVIAEVGLPTEKSGILQVADCQVHLPTMDAQKPVFEIPSMLGDEVSRPEHLQQILTEPWRFGCEEDITCARPFDSQGYAGVARHRAYHHIENDVNPLRGDRKITHAIAAIACMQGVQLPDGQNVSARSVLNDRSVLSHTRSRYTAELTYQLPNRLVPIKMGSHDYNVITRWMMYVQPISRGEAA